MDLTTIPTMRGLWTPWIPFALPQVWPFCWWLVVVLDNYSRRVMRVGVFKQPPSSQQIRVILGRAMTVAGATPGVLITDHDSRFTGKSFRRWSRRRGIEQRFGALGKFGSIAVIERFVRTLKREGLRRILVPYGPQRMRVR